MSCGRGSVDSVLLPSRDRQGAVPSTSNKKGGPLPGRLAHYKGKRNYQLNFKRTWIFRGSIFCVDTFAGITLPNLESSTEVLMLSRP